MHCINVFIDTYWSWFVIEILYIWMFELNRDGKIIKVQLYRVKIQFTFRSLLLILAIDVDTIHSCYIDLGIGWMYYLTCMCIIRIYSGTGWILTRSKEPRDGEGVHIRETMAKQRPGSGNTAIIHLSYKITDL